MSVFLMASASSTVLPFSHSVASEELAIALPQPKVLNLASSMMPVASFTFICSFMTSPHSGAPTMPVPTLGSLLSSDPTLRGLIVMIQNLIRICHCFSLSNFIVRARYSAAH